MEAVTIFKEFVHRVVSLGNLPGPTIRFYFLNALNKIFWIYESVLVKLL